ncbi:MAG: hypothetical protein IJB71_04395 [Bacilli bacterium]|nr:hypothetical protein [Bacilli bacterium]
MNAQDSFFKFINSCSELIDILEKKAGFNNLDQIKQQLNFFTSNKIDLFKVNFKNLWKMLNDSFKLDEITDENVKKDCKDLRIQINASFISVKDHISDLRKSKKKECFYVHSNSQEQFYSRTLSEIFNDMNFVCAQYLAKYAQFTKKTFTDNSWETEFKELNELYEKTKEQMNKTLSQALERLKSKKVKIEARQRASLCPNIVGLQRIMETTKPKKPISKRTHLINNGRQMIDQINEFIYRIGNSNEGLELTTNMSEVKAAIQDFNQLVVNSGSENDIKASLKKLKAFNKSLEIDFEKVQEKRNQTNKKVNDAIQKRREYETKQKDKVLENKKLDKLFSNTDSKKGNYTNFILSDETKPYLNQLNKLQREFGYSHPEYQAVARQFLEHVTANLKKKDSRLLMNQLKKANIVLKSANRIEIPAFLLNPEIFSQGSNSRAR